MSDNSAMSLDRNQQISNIPGTPENILPENLQVPKSIGGSENRVLENSNANVGTSQLQHQLVLNEVSGKMESRMIAPETDADRNVPNNPSPNPKLDSKQQSPSRESNIAGEKNAITPDIEMARERTGDVKSGYDQIMSLCEKNFPTNIQLLQDLLNISHSLSSDDRETCDNFSNICNKLMSEMLHLNHAITEICKTSIATMATSQTPASRELSGPFETLLNVWKKNMLQKRTIGKLSIDDEELMNMAALQNDSTFDNLVPKLDVHFDDLPEEKETDPVSASSPDNFSFTPSKKSESHFLDIKTEWLKRFSGSMNHSPKKSSRGKQTNRDDSDSDYAPSKHGRSRTENKVLSETSMTGRSLRKCRSKTRPYRDSLNLSDIDVSSDDDLSAANGDDDDDDEYNNGDDSDDEDYLDNNENNEDSVPSENESQKPGSRKPQQHYCDICDRSFRTPRSLANHNRACHKTEEFPCHLCSKVFSSDKGLKQHVFYHVRAEKVSKRNSELNQQEEGSSPTDKTTKQLSPQPTGRRSNEVYSCEICGLVFFRRLRYTMHVRTHSQTKAFQCQHCPKKFRNKTSLNNHLVLCHTSLQRHQCPSCNKFFKTEMTLKYHMMMHEGNLPYACTYCDRKFTTTSVRDKHQLTHSDEKPYQCTICDKRFKTPYNLKKHNMLHVPEKNFQCDFCGQQFRQKSTLISHHRTHTGEKPYVCDTCGKAFTQSSILNMHKRIHTGYKPHKCTVCESAFSCGASLRKHMTIHTGEKNYMCKECGRCFARAQSLKYHEQSHTGVKPYLCKECGKRFSCRKHVKRHRLLHSGEMPYSCEVCGKMFRQEYNKKIHMRVHTGDKPFDCKNCGRCFAYKQSAQQHMVHCLKQDHQQTPTFIPYSLQQNHNLTFQQL